MDSFTVFACCIIIGAFLASWIYISQADSQKLQQNRIWINQLPTIVSTLGVLGTFIGITKGLLGFNTQDLTNSIPDLLDGLKAAFFTSLCGMVGSIILSRVVSHKFDMEKTKSDAEKAADVIINTLNRNNQDIISKINQTTENVVSAIKYKAAVAIINTLNRNNEDIISKINQISENVVSAIKDNENISGIRHDVIQLKDDIEEIKGMMQEIRGVLDNIQNINASCTDEIPRLRAVLITATSSISEMDNNIAEMTDEVGDIQQIIMDIKDVIQESPTSFE